MSTRTVYRSQSGRVLLIKHVNGRALWYSVTIAGEGYGPFPWSEASAWYKRHKDADAGKRTGFIVRYDCGAFLRAPGLPHLSPDALTPNPAKACQFSTDRGAWLAVAGHGESMVTVRSYSARYWSRLCRHYKKHGTLYKVFKLPQEGNGNGNA